MSSFTVCLVAIAACLCTSAFAFPYHEPGQQLISLPPNAEAHAAALTNAASSGATAAKINAINWDLLNLYGYEIGYPLLTKNHGPLTSLYAAALPPRSFVGQIDPAFLRTHDGGIKFVGGSTIGVAAI